MNRWKVEKHGVLWFAYNPSTGYWFDGYAYETWRKAYEYAYVIANITPGVYWRSS